MSHFKTLLALTAMCAAASPGLLASEPIVKTKAYSWHGDSVTQGEYNAWSADGRSLKSTYSARPGYFMPISKEWTLKRDISSYPQLSTPNRLHTALYNLALEEMINAVEPDTTLRTGKEWAGVWTRDVSYSILLSMAYMQPEAARISLMKKVSPDGRIIQDTGSGGAWPVSSDRMIWAVAAFEVYKVTGDRKWLEFIYPVITRSLADDEQTVHAPSGLVKGETSFIDWREQSYPRWMQTADIYESEALGTSAVHAKAYDVAAQIAALLGKKKEAAAYRDKSKAIADAINSQLWLDDKGYYAMYRYGRNSKILNPRAETLGEALAVLYDIAPADRARSITEHNPTTPFGAPVFYPQIADIPPYHNNSLWPWVASYWALANAKVGNEQGLLEAIGSVFRPAALFTTNKENLVMDNGDIATELNSSNMLWCLAGNLALTQRILFGIEFEADGLAFHPVVPEALGQTRTLTNFPYRKATLDITVEGFGNRIASFTLNGKEHAPKLPANLKGLNKVVIKMDNKPFETMAVNRVPNKRAPLTPIVSLSHSPELGGPVNNLLSWAPIEYIARYRVLRDGQPVAETRQTQFAATVPGEYQVIGIAGDGTESFASEPVSNYDRTVVEMPGEGTALSSAEISYRPAGSVSGWHGKGFVETDHKTAEISVPATVKDGGLYSLRVVYANGNGPVNTENKCAIRTVLVNGEKVGTIVMPQRGVANWDDWGMSNPVQVQLAPGLNTVQIVFTPSDENMNIATNHAAIDRLVLDRVK